MAHCPGRRVISPPLLLLWAAEALVGERCWLTTLAAYAPAAVFALPMALLVPLTLLRRDPRAGLVLGLCALVLVFPLGNFALHATRPAAGPNAVAVMTYNIHGGKAGLDRVAAEIRSAHPDITCLQEARGLEAEMKPCAPGVPGRRGGRCGRRRPVARHQPPTANVR